MCGSAYLTIAATSAQASTEGFLTERCHRSWATISSANGSLHLAEAIDNFEADVERGVLNTRGWVLQERALLRRTIHFTSTQVYWECGRGIHCETLAQLRKQVIKITEVVTLFLDRLKLDGLAAHNHSF